MTDLPPPPDSDPGPDPTTDPVAELTAEVSAGGGERLASAVHLLRRVVWAIAAAAAATGLVALVLGLGAWGHSLVGLLFVLVACTPAIAILIRHFLR